MATSRNRECDGYSDKSHDKKSKRYYTVHNNCYQINPIGVVARAESWPPNCRDHLREKERKRKKDRERERETEEKRELEN